MTLEATPIEYTRCAYCRNAAKKRVAYKGATRLVCDNHLKLIAKELNENIKLVVVKYDEPILKLPPIVSRNPEHEGAGCWNFRDPDFQKQQEKKRAKAERLNQEKLSNTIDGVNGVVNLLYMIDGASETIVKDKVEYLIVGDYACRLRDDGTVTAVYTYKEGALGYIKFDELKVEVAID